MSTKVSVELTTNWTLVYDASVSGVFTGSISLSRGFGSQLFVTPDGVPPSPATSGIPLTDTMPVAVFSAERLWARCIGGSATVQMQPNIPNVSFSPLDLAVGHVPGAVQSTFGGVRAAVPISGENVIEPVATVLPPFAGIAVSLSSSSAADVGVTIRVNGVGPNGAFMAPVDVVLNGTTPVAVGNMSRVNSLTRLTGDVVGTVTAFNGANTYAVILPNGNQSRSAKYSVPVGYRIGVQTIIATMLKDAGTDDSILMALQSKPMQSSVFGSIFDFTCRKSGSSQVSLNQQYASVVPGPVDLRVIGTASSSSVDAQVYVSSVLINSAVNP